MQMQSDPVLRYTAAGIIASAFLGVLAVVVHGYWAVPNYTIPPELAGLLGIAVSFAATILGVHLGSATTATAGEQATANTQASIRQGGNGNGNGTH